MTATQQKSIRRRAAQPARAPSAGLSARPIQRSMGNAGLSEYLFSHYRVSDPAEQSEVQAERAADRIMAGGRVGTAETAKGDAEISRSPEEGSNPSLGAAGGSGGLPGGVREKMEEGFGRSFEGVRFHHDQHADTLSRALHADAFTQGSDVYFRRGAFNPGSHEGQHLIAHELAHVDKDTGEELHRAVSDEDKVTALLADDTVFKAFYDAIIADPDFLKKIVDDKEYAEKEAAIDAAANAAAGAGGVGGAMARIGYGKDTAAKVAGGAEMLGALATETGSAYGNIAGGVGDKANTNKYKSNAKAITAAGQGMNLVSDVIQAGSGISKARAAGKLLGNNGADKCKVKAQQSIEKAIEKLNGKPAPLTRDVVSANNKLTAIKTDLNDNKNDLAQEKIFQFIIEYKDKTDVKDCIADVKSARSQVGTLVGMDGKGLSAEGKKVLEDRKTSGWDNMSKAIGMGIGHGLSGVGAALESFAFSGSAVNGTFGIIGGVLSAVGGIVSSITGAFSGVTKAKRGVESKRNAEAGKSHAQGLLQSLWDAIDSKNKEFDKNTNNGQANRKTAYDTYFTWKADRIDIPKFTASYKAKDAPGAKKAVMDNFK